MPTPAERKALLYLAGLLCLGAGVRVARNVRREPAPAESRAALARQIDAVDSARRAGKGRARVPRAAPLRRGRAGRASASGAPSAATAPAPAGPPSAPAAPAAPDPSVPIDLDTASAALLERLPRIGPTLAKRIVDDRERRGPFGSLEAFQRVRGVGPAIARELSGRVTFSGTRRLTRAAFPPLGGARSTGAP